MIQNKNIQAESDLQWIENITSILDSKFTIPGTKFKFGIDPIIGLIPVIGDISSFAISGMLLMVMTKHGVSQKVVILMLLNLLVDVVFGSIPIVGNVFDFFYKANDRNIRLLKKHYGEGKYRGSGAGILISIAVILLVILALMIFGLYKLAVFLIGLF